MSTDTIAANADEVRTRTLAVLDRATVELKSIDLRSLKGEAKEAVKEARIWTASASRAVKG